MSLNLLAQFNDFWPRGWRRGYINAGYRVWGKRVRDAESSQFRGNEGTKWNTQDRVTNLEEVWKSDRIGSIQFSTSLKAASTGDSGGEAIAAATPPHPTEGMG